MDIIIPIIYLIIGFIILIKGADLVVDHASALALRAGIPMFVVGLTLVAFGTSLPELSVSLLSAISAYQSGLSADIAVGNIVGSNIANILLILGSSALVAPILVHKRILKRDIPYLIMISAVFMIFMRYFDSSYTINRIEAFILLIFFGLYIYFMLKEKQEDILEVQKDIRVMRSFILLFVGFIGVILGGNLVTSGAETLSSIVLIDIFGMNPLKVTTLVGLSIVAIGTSLPELVTTVTAMKKGRHDIALGNVIGSNIFNILLVGGLSGVIVPLSIQYDVIFDSLIVLVVTVMIYAIMRLNFKLHRLFGAILLLGYIIYLVFIITRSI